MSSVITSSGLLHFLAQIDLSNFNFPGGPRAFTGLTMLVHMFFAELFVGFAIAAPVLQAWGARTGSPRMDRLAHSMVRFNVLTFSTGATFAVLFLVLLVGFWMVLMTGIDTYMVTGGGPNAEPVAEGNVANFGAALSAIFNPMYVEMILHRTFANLSWPAFALATWAAFMYIRSKSEADKAFYDWATSVGLSWGVGFLLAQPIGGFLIVYSLKLAQPEDPASATAAGGAYERLTSGYTSDLLYINLMLVVGLFVLSNLAMYIGAGRHPDRAGRRPIQFFGLVAALAGLYSISPLAQFPFLYMRYIMILVMVLATAGALVSYLRGRMRFRYGSPATSYRVVLLALGVLAAVTALNMGFMKSNSRAPFTIYNQPSYTVENEKPPKEFGE